MKKKAIIKSEEERLVYGEVYRPLDIDSQNEAMTAGEIRKMAHAFISKGLTKRIDENHDCQVTGCLVVESYIAKENDPDGFTKDAWILGVKVIPDELWSKVKSGDINGFSFYGSGQTITLKTKAKMPISGTGFTEFSIDSVLPSHAHEVSVNFSKSGDIIPCVTGETLSHTHEVNKATATESSFDHSHRLIFEGDDD